MNQSGPNAPTGPNPAYPNNPISFPSFAPSPQASPAKLDSQDIQRISIHLPEEYFDSSLH